MALKLKAYTPEYSGIDAEYYLTRKAPVIVIVTDRNTGKTTNIIGYACAAEEEFLLLTRFKNELEAAKTKVSDAASRWSRTVTWSKDEEAFTREDGSKAGYVGSLSGVQDIKNASSIYNKVRYIIMDEAMPVDNKYIKESSQPGYEVDCLRWIMGSVLKGGNNGVKLVLLSNAVSPESPYTRYLTDSDGTSMLSHLARNFQNNTLQNFTVDDPNIYFTMHTGVKQFINDTPEGKFAAGGIERAFFAALCSRIVLPPTVKDKLKTEPLIYTGKYAMRRIPLHNSLIDSYIYYWSPDNHPASPPRIIGMVDYQLYPHYYASILARCEVLDFFNAYHIATRPGGFSPR